jgi:outer membrane protein OmpA-like peptidoglycan-associated protein
MFRHYCKASCVGALLLLAAMPASVSRPALAQAHPASAPASLTPEEAAVLAAIRQAIVSDARIKSAFTVTIEHVTRPDNKTVDPVVVVKGEATGYDELFAVNSDVLSSTDFITRLASIPPGRDAAWDFDDHGPGTPAPRPEFKEPAHVPEIPVCAGLQIVTAISAPDGDYESIKTVQAVDAQKYVLQYTAETRDPWWSSHDTSVKLNKTSRSVLLEDAKSAFRYAHYFVDGGPPLFPGATSIGVSTKILRFLKTRGEAVLELCVTGDECTAFETLRIHRVENTTVPVRVIVDGAPVDLPAIHARAVHADAYWMPRLIELYFLDDERNPLTLATRFGIHGTPPLTPRGRRQCDEARASHNIGFGGSHPPSCDQPMGGDMETLRVVKISTDCRAAGARNDRPGASVREQALESRLAGAGKADVYSIYFSFGRDTLREESAPTLGEIAAILRKHGDWKLRIAGHTDGIGSDERNLDLAQRRAAAVKDALVRQYGIDGARLSTTGFGKRQPIDSNDTAEGRARNRRVELSRI